MKKLKYKITKRIIMDYFYTHSWNSIDNRLKNGTYNILSEMTGKPVEETKKIVGKLRRQRNKCSTMITKDNFRGLNILRGCKAGGVHKIECKNCCFLETGQKLSGRNTRSASDYNKVLKMKNDGSNCRTWNGKHVIDYSVLKLLYNTKKQTNWILTYAGEISLADYDTLYILMQQPFRYLMHNFFFVTKEPEILLNKLLPVLRKIKEEGRDIKRLNNLHIVGSVGLNETKYRIDHVRRYDGFEKHIWFKGLLGPIIDPDLTGISTIRIGADRGKYKRPMKQQWVNDLIKLARKQNVLAFHDK